jgi:hypothetical protein
MMGWRIQLLNGDEEDAITGWRFVTGHKPGTRKAIKRTIQAARRQQYEAATKEH